MNGEKGLYRGAVVWYPWPLGCHLLWGSSRWVWNGQRPPSPRPTWRNPFSVSSNPSGETMCGCCDVLLVTEKIFFFLLFFFVSLALFCFFFCFGGWRPCLPPLGRRGTLCVALLYIYHRWRDWPTVLDIRAALCFATTRNTTHLHSHCSAPDKQ